MANEYAVNQADLSAVANAIREKGKTTEALTFPVGFITAIQELETGTAFASVTVSVVTDTGGSISPTITIVNTYDNTTFHTFTYTGQTVVKIPAGMPYRIDAGKVDKYSAPASVEGLAISGESRTVELVYNGGRRYGYRRTKSESNPSARIEYLYDAIGMTPMSVNKSTGEPDYGDWSDFIDEVCRPVMLKYDGTVDYELDHNDQTKKLDGTASDVDNVSYDGNAMVEFRTFKWVHRSETSTHETVIFSNSNHWTEETYSAQAHTNESGTVQEAFYWAMFEGSYSNDRMRSLGTGTVMNNQTRATENSRAQANGAGWYTIYKSGWDYIADLLTIISKTDNSQEVFGYGYVGLKNGETTNKPLDIGTLKTTPAFCGYSDKLKDVKALYIESIWGNVWDAIAGLVVTTSKEYKAKMTPPYNITGDGYVSTGVTLQGTSGTFTKGSYCSPVYGYLPGALSGSGTTYMCDILYFNSGKFGYAMVGGAYDSELDAGKRALTVYDDATITGTHLGTRLSYLAP